MASTSPTAGAGMPPTNDSQPQRRDRDNSVTCEFCHATIASASGHVIKLSDDTRAFRDAAEDRDKYKNQCATLTTRVAELEAEVERLTAAPAPADPPKKHFLI